jgi:hypothetical protein
MPASAGERVTVRDRIPRVTFGLVGLAVLLTLILLFVLGRGLFGGGEEKPITRDEIENPSR